MSQLKGLGGMWWLWATLAAIALGVIFYDGLQQMVASWGREEYSYAYLVPFISAWLIWQKRNELAAIKSRGSWAGIAVVILGISLAIFGELSTIYTIIHYAFVVTLFGLALAWVGWHGFRIILAPLIYLAFMIPLPTFLYQGLSAELQLISSSLGVAFIELMGVSVFLEGNVIDLGTYQLQVVEACSGLRYLFPLASFGFLLAYLYRGPLWHKAVLFLSTGPLTILINSLRIGVIGVLVEHFGIEAAEGFLHFFEGWIIFLAAVGLLLGEMWALARLGGYKAPLGELLRIDNLWPKKRAPGNVGVRGLSRPYMAGVALLVVAAVAVSAIPARSEITPEWKSLAAFPMRLGEWVGRTEALEKKYLDVLKLDDYVLANYRRPDDRMPVNLYVAYYGSQRKGASIHSPRSCIPGGGWEIADLSEAAVDNVGTVDGSLPVNRVVIAKGASKQLVYYWFQQRGRLMTNEYVVKWSIFWDALTRNRTDGALVRVVTPLFKGEELASADRRLSEFVRTLYPQVASHIPG